MSAWGKTTLGSVAALVGLKVPASSLTLENYVSTENMLPDFGGVVDSPSLPSLEKFNSYCQSDTLFSNIRTYFKKVWFANKSGGASADVLVFRTQDPTKLDPRFLNYVLSSQKFIDFSDLTAKGAKMPRGDKGAMLGFEFNLPPIQIQRAIAQVLGALDDKIALNRRMNATLEAMARALFKDWFVDFGPIRAKIAGSAPTLAPAIWDLFPSAIGEDGLPVGWFMSTVNSLFTLTMGQSPLGETFNLTSDGLPFYQGRTDFGFRYPDKRVYCTAPTRFAEAGDTLVSVRAPVGDVNMAIELCCIGRGVASVRHPKNYRSFTYYAMHNLRERFLSFNSEGTVFGSINKNDFQNLTVISPNETTLMAFNEICSPLDGQIEANEKESKNLAKLRDTLLPKLLSGEFKMGDILLN